MWINVDLCIFVFICFFFVVKKHIFKGRGLLFGIMIGAIRVNVVLK